jgi:hypothetical protein
MVEKTGLVLSGRVGYLNNRSPLGAQKPLRTQQFLTFELSRRGMAGNNSENAMQGCINTKICGAFIHPRPHAHDPCADIAA